MSEAGSNRSPSPAVARRVWRRISRRGGPDPWAGATEAVLRQAIERGERSPDLFTALAKVLQGAGDLDGAEAAHMEAIASAPGSARHHQKLGLFYRAQRRDVEAARSMRTALEIDSRPDRWWQQLGSVLLRLGDWHAAADAYEQAIARNRGSGDYHRRLAEALGEATQREEVAALRTATELEPDRVEWRLDLADRLEGLGNPHGAATIYSALPPEVRDRRQLVLRHAACLTALKAGSEAAELLRDAIGRSGPDVRLWVALGEAHLAMLSSGVRFTPQLGIVGATDRDVDGAIEAFGKALELEPELAELQVRRGDLLRSAGEPLGAVEAYERALEIEPGNAGWHEDLGVLYQDQAVADYAKAIEAYRRSLAIAPNRSVARARLVRLLSREQDWTGALDAASWALPKDGSDDLPRSLTEYLMRSDGEPGHAAELLTAIAADGWRGNDAWWQGVELRLLSLGWFGLGFRAKDAQAQRRYTAIRRAKTLTPGRSQVGAQALVALGRPSAALTLLDEVDRRQMSEWECMVHDRLRADVGLMLGDPGPIVGVREAASELAPIPREEEFRSLIEGKHVAVVGPADTEGRYGADIDAADIVIRTKYLQEELDDESRAKLGTRTDISYYAGRDAQILDDDIRALVQDGALKMAVARPFLFGPDMSSATSHIRLYRADMRAYFRATPLGIQRILYDVLQFKPATVRVYNVDFFSSPRRFREGYRDHRGHGFHGSVALNDVIVVHDLREDFRFSKALMDAGLVEFDAQARLILDDTTEEYLRRLERAGPL